MMAVAGRLHLLPCVSRVPVRSSANLRAWGQVAVGQILHLALPPIASCMSSEGQGGLQKAAIGSPRPFLARSAQCRKGLRTGGLWSFAVGRFPLIVRCPPSRSTRGTRQARSEEHTSELQSLRHLV